MSNTCDPDIYSLLEHLELADDNFIVDISNNNHGEGFAGQILFVTLTNKKSQEKRFLTIKQQKPGALEWSNLAFDNEIYFYAKIWPTFNKYYKENTGKSIDFVPKCLGSSNDGVRRIVMQNIKTFGYNINKTTETFSKEQFTEIFKIYGIYHGISMAIREIKREEFSTIVEKMNVLETYFRKNDHFVEYFLNTLRKIQGYFDVKTEKHFIDKLQEYEKIGPQLIRKAIEDMIPRTIIHGDCWSNNYMFKYKVSFLLYDEYLLGYLLV